MDDIQTLVTLLSKTKHLIDKDEPFSSEQKKLKNSITLIMNFLLFWVFYLENMDFQKCFMH